jgi:type IV pilus assembly protein PilX
MKHISPKVMQKQQGVVLIITLLILLLLTVIGVNAMQTNTQEEKMAGNMRDRNLAFEAAEAALRDAEAFLSPDGTIVNLDAFTGSNGLYGPSDTLPADFFDGTNWDASTSKAYSGTVGGVYAQPRFIIQVVQQFTAEETEINAGGGYGSGASDTSESGTVTMFRITARGAGGSDRSQVILQSHYGRYGLGEI